MAGGKIVAAIEHDIGARDQPGQAFAFQALGMAVISTSGFSCARVSLPE